MPDSRATYLDAFHFDQLQDDRAEASTGTGEPITLTQAVRTFLASAPPASLACQDSPTARARSDYSRARATGTPVPASTE